MNIGGLDRRINIQIAGVVFNTYGESVKTWSLFEEVWAQIERAPAAVEKNSGEQIVSVNKVVFNVRWSDRIDSVNPTYRISYGGKIYNILGVHEVGRKERMRIITELIVD